MDRICVAVLTYRRPLALARLLPLLLEHAAQLQPPADVLVVDNDPEGSAQQWVGSFAASALGSVVLRYVNETTPGIAAARNRALDEAASADALVFIDDDETPCEKWLTNLVTQWRTDGSAAVTGPVPPEYEAEPDPWIVGAGVFTRQTRVSGTHVNLTGTGNLLIDMAWVRRLGLRFDLRFGTSGGEDTLFTGQLVQRGGTITWCAEAVALEHIPISRMTRDWVMRRRFSYGNTRVRTALALCTTTSGRVAVRLLAHQHAALLLARGVAHWMRGAIRSDPGQRGLGATQLANAAGSLSGAYGLQYLAYRRKPEKA